MSLSLHQSDSAWVYLSDETSPISTLSSIDDTFQVVRPSLCTPPFETDRLRLEVSGCRTGIWPIIDTVRLRGQSHLLSDPRLSLSFNLGPVWSQTLPEESFSDL